MDPWKHHHILTRFTPKGFDKSEIEMAFGDSDNKSFRSKVVPILVINPLRACTRLPSLQRLCFGILTKVMQHQRLTRSAQASGARVSSKVVGSVSRISDPFPAYLGWPKGYKPL